MDFLEQLNSVQREAVMYNDGPELVIAGAGSGKTRVLTYKVAYLIQQGVPANNILALTFTNKAAREMKERIIQLVPPEAARYLWMGTFHHICARILRQEADKLGYTRDFTIYDTTDSKSLIKQICKERGLDEKVYKPSNVLARISAAKNVLESPEAYATNRDHMRQDRFDRLYDMAEIYHLYQLRLKSANAMDFDDLLMLTCHLMQQFEGVRAYYQNIFRYVLVDEYQDTNYAQYLIVKLLAEPENHVCVVGDDAQSIYSFRGADIRNILTFQRGYANARLFKLERNYRSTQNIVRAANSLIHKNEHQIYKEVYSEKEVGESLIVTPYMSDRDEAAGVAQQIARSRGSYEDIAILYRTNAQSRAFENELRRLNIPYRIYGGTGFYQRKEIKDAICYFRLAANPKDNEALLRVVNFPARGVGETTMRKVSEQAIVMNKSMMEVMDNPAEAGLEVSAGTQTKIAAFAQMMMRFREAVETQDAYAFAELVLRESGVMTAAMADRSPEGVDRKENLDELLSGIHDFVQQRTDEGISFTPVQDFLAEVSLLTDQDDNLKDTAERVTLMTVHAAKGLEFKDVYIAGLEENLFPSQHCVSAPEIEEERRLLYVAVTRAMERCYLSFARQRFKNGTVNFSSPSRFLKDFDTRYVRTMSAAAPRPTPQWGAWQMPTSRPTASPTVTPTPTLKNLKASKDLTPPKATDIAVKAEDRVAHRVFGKGTVLRLYRENDNDKIDIQFDTAGKKTLLLTYAKLEKIE